MNDNNDNCSKSEFEDGSSVSSPIAISSTSSNSMTFNSQVLVNVEEFVYYSVKLGIRFQLLNNNIVVGPYYEGEIPATVAALLEATHSKADQSVITKARSTLQVSEAVEKEADTASLHALSREELHVIRRQTSADDLFYCKGLLTASSKNTFLSLPATNPHNSSKKKRMPILSATAKATEQRSGAARPQAAPLPPPELIALVNNSEQVFTRCRDGSIGWEAIQHLTFSDTGALQEPAEDAKQQQRGSRPLIQGTKPAKNSSADSFHINKKKQQQQSGTGAPSNPLDTDSPKASGSLTSPPQISEEDEEGDEENSADHEKPRPSSKRLSTSSTSQSKSKSKSSSDSDSDQQAASWADEQSADVLTYYINASAVSQSPAAPINLPEATATATATPVPHSSPGTTTTTQVSYADRQFIRHSLRQSANQSITPTLTLGQPVTPSV